MGELKELAAEAKHELLTHIIPFWRGMRDDKFGDVYKRQHPDWAIQIPGREGSLCRNQYVLDLTRKEVRDYAYESVASVLRLSLIHIYFLPLT